MNDDFPPTEADGDSAPATETSLKDEAVVEEGAVSDASPDMMASPAEPVEETPMFEQHHAAANLPEFPAPSPAPGAAAGERNDRFRPPVSQIPVEMQAVIGRVKVSVAELMGAEPGARFKLDSKFGEPVELQVNGKRIGYGEIVADDRDNLVGIRMISLEPDF